MTVAHGFLTKLVPAFLVALILTSPSLVFAASKLELNTQADAALADLYNKQPAAPQIPVAALSGRTFSVGEVAGSGQLLFFLSPDCPICKTLLPVLKTMHRTEKDIEIVLMSDGDDAAAHEAFVAEEGLEEFDYALSEVVGRSYGVGKLPYGVLIDARGVVASLGIVNSREHLESLFEAEALGVGSIQEYLGPVMERDAVGQFDPNRS